MWTTSDFQKILPHSLYQEMLKEQVDFSDLNEIRIRKLRPSSLIGKNGRKEIKGLGSQEFDAYFLSLCKHSPYAYADEIKNGYITIKGGHRIGICGQVSLKEGEVFGLNYVSSLNIRIHREQKDSIKKYAGELYRDGRWLNTLIVSIPGAGKTTLLRDLVRIASDGSPDKRGNMRPYTVSLIDERNEIAASVMGVPELDVGKNTDILSMSGKAEGILFMLRSMAPEIIAFDELGGDADYAAVRKAVYSGVTVFTTIHGRSRDNLIGNSNMNGLLKEGIFERILYLDGPQNPGQVLCLTDGEGREITAWKEN